MLTAPIGIGWKYFAMLMSLALIVPVGLIVFNLIATGRRGAAHAGAAALRDPERSRRSHSGSGPRSSNRRRRRLAPQEHHRLDRGDPLRAYRRWRLRRLRGAPLLVPEDDRPDDGRAPGPDLLLDDVGRHPGRLRAALPGRGRTGRGRRRLQVLRPHRRQRLQLDRLDRRPRALDRDRAHPRQRDPQPRQGRGGRARPVGGDSLEWLTLSPPTPTTSTPPRRAQLPPDARHPRRDRAPGRPRRIARRASASR